MEACHGGHEESVVMGVMGVMGSMEDMRSMYSVYPIKKKYIKTVGIKVHSYTLRV